MRRYSRVSAPIFLALFLLPACVSSGEAGKDSSTGGNGGVLNPGNPTFLPARSSPAQGEIYLSGHVVDRQTVRLHLEMVYPATWGKPYEFRARIAMPEAVQAVGFSAGGTWPEGDVRADIKGGGGGTWDVSVSIRDWNSWTCLFGPPWTTLPPSRVMRFGTITVRLLASGNHAVTVSADGDRDMIRECAGERTPPAYGGTIAVP